jgi:glycosyltransferase involved in cell wall biosynthesis
MISVIVPTHDSAAVLGPCLSALVPAAVTGLVREVILADGGSADGTLTIAEDAGARVVAGDVAAAVATAKGDWLLILLPTTRLEPGWEAETDHHIKRFTGRSACYRLAVDGGGPAARLREWLAGLGAPTIAHGLLVERARYGAAGAPRRLGARAFVAG